MGFDADLTLLDFRKSDPIRSENLLTRHATTLYENHRSGCHVIDVIRRGKFVVQRGAIVQDASRGIFQRPSHE